MPPPSFCAPAVAFVTGEGIQLIVSPPGLAQKDWLAAIISVHGQHGFMQYSPVT